MAPTQDKCHNQCTDKVCLIQNMCLHRQYLLYSHCCSPVQHTTNSPYTSCLNLSNINTFLKLKLNRKVNIEKQRLSLHCQGQSSVFLLVSSEGPYAPFQLTYHPQFQELGTDDNLGQQKIQQLQQQHALEGANNKNLRNVVMVGQTIVRDTNRKHLHMIVSVLPTRNLREKFHG